MSFLTLPSTLSGAQNVSSLVKYSHLLTMCNKLWQIKWFYFWPLHFESSSQALILLNVLVLVKTFLSLWNNLSFTSVNSSYLRSKVEYLLVKLFVLVLKKKIMILYTLSSPHPKPQFTLIYMIFKMYEFIVTFLHDRQEIG